MAGNQAAGCGGWALAGILLVALVSQCGKDPSPPTTPLPLLSSAESIAPARYEYVQSRSLNCRSGPSTSSAIVESLSRSDFVRIARDENGWSLLDRSSDCWVSSTYLSPTAPATPRPRRQASSQPQSAYSSGSRSSSSNRSRRVESAGSCPCSGSRVCIGPRGGRYCITSGGNKRYGV